MGNEKNKQTKLFDGLKKSAKNAAKNVADASKQAGKSAAKVATAVADQTVKAKKAVDKKVRDYLDKSYKEHLVVADANVAALRDKNFDAGPAEILDLLEAKLKRSEQKTSADSDGFTSDAVLFVMSAVAVHGTHFEDKAKRQTLIDIMLVLDNKTVQNMLKVAGTVVVLLSKRVAVLATLATAAAKAGSKTALLQPLMQLSGIKNPGKQSASWLVAAATRKILGPPPKAWPKEQTAPKAAPKTTKKTTSTTKSSKK